MLVLEDTLYEDLRPPPPTNPDIVMLSLNSKFEIVEVCGFLRRKPLVETDRLGQKLRDCLEVIQGEIEFPKHFWEISDTWEPMGVLSKEFNLDNGHGYVQNLWMKKVVP